MGGGWPGGGRDGGGGSVAVEVVGRQVVGEPRRVVVVAVALAPALVGVVAGLLREHRVVVRRRHPAPAPWSRRATRRARTSSSAGISSRSASLPRAASTPQRSRWLTMPTTSSPST